MGRGRIVKEVVKKKKKERKKLVGERIRVEAAEFSTPFRNPYVPLQLFNLFR